MASSWASRWRKKLAEVIESSVLLIPMVTPLFLGSKPCREETQLFLHHEQKLERDDLILPVYFIECPALEKESEIAKDPLAREILRRQMFDWRKKANLPLEQPEAREAILTLARAVAVAGERAGEAVAPALRVAYDHTRLRNASGAARHRLARGERRTAVRRQALEKRTILWVDDRPDNNVWERRALQTYGMQFVLARSTAEAEGLLQSRSFDAVISNLGRPGDRRAGFTLLARARISHPQAPYFIYTGSRAPELIREAQARGAQGLTDDPAELISMVVTALAEARAARDVTVPRAGASARIGAPRTISSVVVTTSGSPAASQAATPPASSLTRANPSCCSRLARDRRAVAAGAVHQQRRGRRAAPWRARRGD